MLYLVIAGAYYYDRKNNMILIPHYTGEFQMVDCSRWMTIENLKESYQEDYIESVKNLFVEYEGVKYYEAEYYPYSTSNEWELLSDLSNLIHIEESYDFE